MDAIVIFCSSMYTYNSLRFSLVNHYCSTFNFLYNEHAQLINGKPE